MKTLTILLGLILSFNCFAQDESHVKWKFNVSPAENNGEVELQFVAEIEEGWHMYSQVLPSDEGPLPTIFTYEASDNYKLIGKVEEENVHSVMDPAFGVQVNYLDGESVFRQTIKTEGNTTVDGTVSFMLCNDEMCLPPTDVKFHFDVK